jgi:hypothetical protein
VLRPLREIRSNGHAACELLPRLINCAHRLCWYTATHVCVQRYMRVIVFLVQCTEEVCASEGHVPIARDQLDDRPKEHLLIGCYLCEAIESQLSSIQL